MEPQDNNNFQEEPQIEKVDFTQPEQNETPRQEFQPNPQTVEEKPQLEPVAETTKNNHKKLWMVVLAILVGLVIVGIAGYLAYTYLNNSTTNQSASNTSLSTIKNPLIDEVKDIYTDSATAESTMADTNDGSDAQNVTNAATAVGGQIDENNL